MPRLAGDGGGTKKGPSLGSPVSDKTVSHWVRLRFLDFMTSHIWVTSWVSTLTKMGWDILKKIQLKCWLAEKWYGNNQTKRAAEVFV